MNTKSNQRLQEWRQATGRSQRELADILGVSQSYIGNIEAGRSEPSRNFLLKLSEHFGLRIDWVLNGTGAQSIHAIDAEISDIKEHFSDKAVIQRMMAEFGDGATVRELFDALDREAAAKSDSTRHNSSQIAHHGIDFTIVPLHEAWLSAGAGRANGRANIIQHLAFRSDWLQRTASDPSRCCIARVAGDSMLPTLCPGDAVLIDPAAPPPAIRKRTPKDTRPAPIWAILDNGEARVKRIERPAEDTFIILSDNPAFMPEWRIGPQAATVQLIGKVLWWGHTAAN